MSKADALLEEIIEKLRESSQVRAVWLVGSRGRGTNDEFSDIDCAQVRLAQYRCR